MYRIKRWDYSPLCLTVTVSSVSLQIAPNQIIDFSLRFPLEVCHQTIDGSVKNYISQRKTV